ncbi:MULTISPECIES: nitroreductase family protein [Serratia]|uniref:Nitroreductase family protein n=1 Tax=Serratia marcescens TaxID=615 RepID=A0AAP8PT64_SERMA|nr:nitroreductase family protein [Serratia marcescens]ETX45000.1 hypothetical protein P812_03291 [Serratia marcescens BIDMC 50]POP15344.1 hypothetical protein C3R40_17615 [Serratia marcescens]CAI2128810.1 SagB-type dehydrogenase domain [Serratia marcescens]HEI8506847.1 nitroreductase family protein [Serratia marcescens]
MKATHMSTVLSGAQFSHHNDLYALLPKRPKLIPELIFIPESDTRVAVYGAYQPRILTCVQGINTLAVFLERLDGVNVLESVLTDDATMSRENALGMLSLLFRYGFLEEGEGLDDGAPSHLASYCGRFVDNTRLHANRTAALQSARRRRLALVCPEDVSSLLQHALAPMAASIDVLTERPTSSALPWDDALIIFDGSESDVFRQACADGLHQAGVRYLSCIIGADRTLVGPYTLPNISASYQCARTQCEQPSPANDRQEVAFRAVYAAHELGQILLGLSSESYLNKVVSHSHRGEGEYTLAYKVARIPGTALSGLGHAAYLPPGEEAFTAWQHHIGTRLPPQGLLPPRSHQMHFTLDNLNRHASRPVRLHGQQHINLPDSALAERCPPPWRMSAMPSQPLTLANLGWLLRHATGYQKGEDGTLRRIAPSGGQLLSCDMFVVVRRPLPEISCGAWFYLGEKHQLVRIDGIDCQQLEHLLQHPEEPISLIISGNLNRVRGKYNDFSYNIVNLDAGVVNQYCALSARAAGWTLREDHGVDLQWLASLLFFTQQDNPHILCQVLHVQAPPSQGEPCPAPLYETASSLVAVSHRPRPAAAPASPTPAALSSLATVHRDEPLSALLERRRATYDYADSPFPETWLNTLIAVAHAGLEQSRLRGMPALPMEPWILLPEASGELAAGIYQCSQADRRYWRKRDSGFGRAHLADCINQLAFHKAGALLMWVADLEKTLHDHGAAGYRMQLQNAAASAMQCWLAALDCGLTGTLAGGVIEEGLIRHAGADGYREAPLFCLVLASPPPAEGV